MGIYLTLLYAFQYLCLTEHCKSSQVNLSVSVYINRVCSDQVVINHLCCPERHRSLSLSLLSSLFQLVDEEKSLVMTEMEKLVALCQQLQMGAKTPVQGKSATFQKVPVLRLCVLSVRCVHKNEWVIYWPNVPFKRKLVSTESNRDICKGSQSDTMMKHRFLG